MMENRLRNHVEALFQNMPQNQNVNEMKEEILQNLIDKYHDLIAEGKDEETAYSIAVASIGDISSLFEPQSTPPEEYQKQKNKSALLTSIAIMLYICSILPPILLSTSHLVETLAPALMFIMIALATGLLIYNSKTKPRRYSQETIVGEFKQWQSGTPSVNTKFKAISNALWSVTVAVYLIVSFLTFAWHITWLIFIIAIAVDKIIKLILTIKD